MQIRWQDWSRPDGTNTTWMRDIEGDSILVKSWEDSLKEQHLRKAAESQSINLTLLASTPMHDRLTFEHSEAVDEKMEERLRRDGPVGRYQGWMEEIENQAARHTGRRGDKSSPEKSKKAIRMPPVHRCVYTLCFLLKLLP
jgi:histone-lysine N-methyltransferase SUV39H